MYTNKFIPSKKYTCKALYTYNWLFRSIEQSLTQVSLCTFLHHYCWSLHWLIIMRTNKHSHIHLNHNSSFLLSIQDLSGPMSSHTSLDCGGQQPLHIICMAGNYWPRPILDSNYLSLFMQIISMSKIYSCHCLNHGNLVYNVVVLCTLFISPP